MDSTRLARDHDDTVVASPEAMPASFTAASFRDAFTYLFETNHARLFRFLDRMSGDPELAADLAQETFVRLYRRNALPDTPEGWLISVALNLYRNVRARQRRRRLLMTLGRGARAHSDPLPAPNEEPERAELQLRVRTVLDAMTERERSLLLLRAEGYSYRDMATALEINEASVGVLLARAKRAFRERYGDE